jgi:uncharacterized membrane protein
MRHLGQVRSTAVAAIGLSILLSLVAPFTALAQAPSPGPQAAPVTSPTPPTKLTVVSTYPSQVVDPGVSAVFDIEVTAPAPERVGLQVAGLPDGWKASFRGGDSTVGSVYAGATAPPLELHLDVPDDARPGNVDLTVQAAGESANVDLPLEVIVADTTGGSVALTTDFPYLRGDTKSPFSFDLDLANDTSRAITFSLEGTGPEGWDVSVRPATEEQAASILVDADAHGRVRVTATPPAGADAGQYPIQVQASGDGYTADAQLVVEITGSYSLTLDAPDGRLNASGTAGSAIDYPVVVVNDGTAPLEAVKLTGTAPREWQVTFEPDTIDTIQPQDVAQAVAHITPAAGAVAGDYDVTLRAGNDQANDSIAVRTTVETSTVWGVVGIAVIVLVLVGLFLVFRRYGRR